MSNKVSIKNMNASNGFKKRILRPVSTNKHSGQNTTQMKASRVLNLKDSLSLKIKYNYVVALIQQMESSLDAELQSLPHKPNQQLQMSDSITSFKPKGIQFIKNQIKKHKNIQIKNLKEENNLKQNKRISQSIQNQTQFINIKSCQQILNDIKLPNLQQGVKYLYQQNQYLNKIVQSASTYLGCILLRSYKSNSEVQKILDQELNGDENTNESLIKYIKVLQKSSELKQKDHKDIDSPLLVSKNQSPITYTKFKPIYSARQQEQQQLQSLKKQLNDLKYQNKNLQKLLSQKQADLKNNFKICEKQQSVLNSSISNKPPFHIQSIHKQICAIYDQILKSKDQQIQNKKLQLLQIQQKLQKITNQNDYYKQISIEKLSKSLSNKPGLRLNKQNSTYSSQYNNKNNFQSTPSYTTDLYNVIQQQFTKMRTGFIKKIQNIQKNTIQKQKQTKRQLFRIQKQYQKSEMEKRILMKKYDFLLNDNN